MVDLTSKDRLQPSLLDRLTDLEPDVKAEPRERRVLSMRALRQSVERDLAWLFNANGLASAQDLSAYPHVATSVLNYGFPDIAGKTASSLDAAQIERAMADVIRAFEPRIIGETVRVSAVTAGETTARHNTVSFTIEGDLWAQPYPERLFFRTDLDLEAGEVRVVDEGARR
jgi:type VI secretion system protein ImpF